ncbi:MAG TPA: BlaI/MecI/CopY family transcriptional regulator [Kofleriaceae bacterium]|nr:BlaI/MecI/CopY family transcriptional regulator [Kofleriaceae bacterium]
MAPPPLPGGDLERAVLEAVWELAEATARDVHDRVGAPTGLAYTTIAKVLDRLVAKKLCKRQRAGRIYVYAPAIAREKVEQATARSTVGRLLGDSPRPAIATLVDAVASVDPDLLDELARVVAARRRARRGS